METSFKLVVLDIDGVLTRGEAKALDLSLLATLADLNRRARQTPGHPAVTVCSGRPAPYVEAILQGMDGHVPAVYENGAGLYSPVAYDFLPHPATRTDGAISQVKERLMTTLVADGIAFVQPGKEHTLTLFATHPSETSQLSSRAAEALGRLADQVDLVYSTSCLNILPHGVDKGKGIEFLSENTGIPTADMLGIGDSDVDIPFLAKVGRSAAPVNGNQGVKAIVNYVSPKPTSEGVREILAHFGVLA